MLKLMLIAFACAFYDGLMGSAINAIPIMKSNGRRRLSVFSFGLAMVVAVIVGNAKNVKNKDENAHKIVKYYKRCLKRETLNKF